MRWALLGAVALGAYLALAPFLRYRLASPHPAAHADHRPRHGGILGMAGDVHLEVVRRQGRIEIFLSDSYRRALRAKGGRVEFADGPSTPLAWQEDRLVAPDHPASDELTCTVLLDDGSIARMTVEF